MKNYLKIGIIIITLIIQLTIVNLFSIQGLKPDLILLVVIVFSLLHGAGEGAISGFTSGLLQDIFSSGLLGVNALVKTIIGFICGVLKINIFAEHILFIIPIITFLASISQCVLIFFILQAFGTEYNFIWSLKQVAIPEALYNSLLSPFVFLIIKRILK